MAVVLDALQNGAAFASNANAGFTTFTDTSFTVGSGSNRALLVAVICECTTAANSLPTNLLCNWDSTGTNQSMPRIATITDTRSGNDDGIYLFAITAPTSGLKTLSISGLSSTTSFTFTYISFTGVSQAAGINTFANAANLATTGTTTANVVINTPNDAAVAFFMTNATTGISVNQTTWIAPTAGPLFNYFYAANYVLSPGSSPAPMTFTTISGFASDWVAVNIVAAPITTNMINWYSPFGTLYRHSKNIATHNHKFDSFIAPTPPPLPVPVVPIEFWTNAGLVNQQAQQKANVIYPFSISFLPLAAAVSGIPWSQITEVPDFHTKLLIHDHNPYFLPLPLGFQYGGPIASTNQFVKTIQHQGKPGYPLNLPPSIPAGIAGIAWNTPYPTPSFSALPSYHHKFEQFIPLPLVVSYFNGGVRSSSVRFTQTIQHQGRPGYPVKGIIIPISGMAWHTAYETPPVARFKAEQYKDESAFTNAPATLPVGITGMAWNIGYESPPPTKFRFEQIKGESNFTNTAATLPTAIGGIAWHVAYDVPKFQPLQPQFIKSEIFVNQNIGTPFVSGLAWHVAYQPPPKTRFRFEQIRDEAAFNETALTLPTAISGMAWYQLFSQPPVTRFAYEKLKLEASIGSNLPLTFTGIPWFALFDSPKIKRIVFSDSANWFTQIPLNFFWYRSFELLPSRARIISTDSLISIMPAAAPLLIKAGWQNQFQLPIAIKKIIGDSNTAGFELLQSIVTKPQFVYSFFDQPKFINKQFLGDRTNIVFKPLTQTFVQSSDQSQFAVNKSKLILDRTPTFIVPAKQIPFFIQSFDKPRLVRSSISDNGFFAPSLQSVTPSTPISGMAWFEPFGYPALLKPAPWQYQSSIYLQIQMIDLVGVVVEVNVNYPSPTNLATYPGFIKKYI